VISNGVCEDDKYRWRFINITINVKLRCTMYDFKGREDIHACAFALFDCTRRIRRNAKLDLGREREKEKEKMVHPLHGGDMHSARSKTKSSQDGTNDVIAIGRSRSMRMHGTHGMMASARVRHR